MKEKPKGPLQRELVNEPLNEKSDHIQVPNLTGTWYVIEKNDQIVPVPLFLLEDEEFGDEAAHCIVDRWGNLVWSGCYNDWDDLEEAVADGTVKAVKDDGTNEWRIYRDIAWKGAFG